MAGSGLCLLGLFLLGLVGREYAAEDVSVEGLLFGAVLLPFGLFAALSRLRLLLKGPVAVRLNETGMQVRWYSNRPLPWEKVLGVECVEADLNSSRAWPFKAETRSLRFWVEPDFHWKMNWMDRLMTWRWSKDAGNGYFTIDYAVTDQPIEAFLDAFQAIAPEHARPTVVSV